MSRRRQPFPLGDGRAADVGRMLGLSAAELDALLPRLHKRGLPLPDPDTGRFDLDAVAEWRRRRHPHLYRPPLASAAPDDDAVVRPRLGVL